jgi:hypothetical protein
MLKFRTSNYVLIIIQIANTIFKINVFVQGEVKVHFSIDI